MPDSQVFVHHVTIHDRQKIIDVVEQIFAEVPATQKLSAKSKVLLKPNLLARYVPEKAVTTHPEVVRAVVLALQKRGVTNITLADSPGGPYSAMALKSIYKGSGLAAACEELGVTLYTACKSVTVPASVRPAQLVRQFTLISPAVDCDFIINLPKLKTHALTGLSGAVKNLFGLVPGFQKPEFHSRFPDAENFGQMLVDLCETADADLHIVDGILAMEGDGPAGGTPRVCNLLFAGENPYLVDLALCRTIGMDPMFPPFLAAAHAEGLCPAALDETLLVGSAEAKKTFTDFQMPRSYGGKEVPFLSGLPAPVRAGIMQFMLPRPVIKKNICIGCGKCVEICPKTVITLRDKKAHIAPKECIRCFCCHEMCPAKAIDIRKNFLLQI